MSHQGFLVVFVVALLAWLVAGGPALLAPGQLLRTSAQCLHRHRWILLVFVGLALLGEFTGILRQVLRAVFSDQSLSVRPASFAEALAASGSQVMRVHWKRLAFFAWPQLPVTHALWLVAILFLLFHRRLRHAFWAGLPTTHRSSRWLGWLLWPGALLALGLGLVPFATEIWSEWWQLRVGWLIVVGILDSLLGLIGGTFLLAWVLVAVDKVVNQTRLPTGPADPTRSFGRLLRVSLLAGAVSFVAGNIGLVAANFLPGCYRFAVNTQELLIDMIVPVGLTACFAVPLLVVLNHQSLMAALRGCGTVWQRHWRLLVPLLLGLWIAGTASFFLMELTGRLLLGHQLLQAFARLPFVVLQALLSAWWLISVTRLLSLPRESPTHSAEPASC